MNHQGMHLQILKKEKIFFQQLPAFIRANKNVIVLVDNSFASNFSRLTNLETFHF